ncbi:MAG: LicD family protein [Tannerellaceae bacterium]|jgi:lipopolysaccharide cholinephosphotransferase|nr:LicD family protein [Tannerellaceae bacterium]
MTNTDNSFDDLFPDNRSEGETVIRQAQLVLLRMLKVIDHICRRHKIEYWLCSGTLLGAIRNKGFIPWDDDLDICMLRDDYERFVDVAGREFPDDMALQTRETDPGYKYLCLPCKVRDRKSVIIIPCQDKESPLGLFVDIFPADRYHLNCFVFGLEKMIKAYNTFICKSLDSVYFAHESTPRRILSFFHPVFLFLVTRYMKHARRLIARNKKLGDKCRIGHGFDTLWKRYFRHSDIYPLIEVTFEGSTFLAPHSPDTYLRTLYGDNYMTPLPESKRTRHASIIKPVI